MATELGNLRHFHAIAEIARQRSVRRAASLVFKSQPALTRALAQTEQLLGNRLFERSAAGMIPTDATNALVERIDRALMILKTAEKLFDMIPLHRLVTRLQLQVLIEAVDSENISTAADRLGIHQPSATRAIRDLEAICRRKLFTRTPRGVDATREAKEFARIAGISWSELQQGLEAFRECHGQIDGRITVGSLPLARSTLIPVTITRVLETYPEVKLRVVDGPYPEMLHELRSGKLDVIVGALRLPPPPDVRQEALFTDSLSVIVRAGHPLSRVATLSATDLAGLEWVLAPEGTPARKLFDQSFRSMHLAPPRRLIECSSFAVIRGLLRISDRAALLSVAQARREIDSGELVAIGPPLPATERPIGLALRVDWRPTRAQAAFLDTLRQVVAEQD